MRSCRSHIICMQCLDFHVHDAAKNSRSVKPCLPCCGTLWLSMSSFGSGAVGVLGPFRQGGDLFTFVDAMGLPGQASGRPSVFRFRSTAQNLALSLKKRCGL